MKKGSSDRASYGWDAPAIMLSMLGIGAAASGAGLALVFAPPLDFAVVIGAVLIVIGIVPLLLGLAMLQYGVWGKMRTRDAMLSIIDWRGDEAVLDVGTGAGLLLVGAAKRLDRGGRAIGIDIWASKDLSNNAVETTLRNIKLEGVANRVDIRTEDATGLTFEDGSFDVVLSLLCLHNIEPKEAQSTACREIARLLRPGGQVVIGDYIPTHGYAAALAVAGLRVKQSRSAFRVAGALMWILHAEKPRPL